MRLTSAAGFEDDPAFSPDGRMVAYTRNGNLFTVDLATQRERQLTSDGGPQRFNGRLDWVYSEEVYGRGGYRAFWWNPDSTRIAFLQLDQHAVPEITLTDHITARQALEVFDYPKSGDPNPTVKLGVVRAAGGSVSWIDTSKYSAGDHLIVNVTWSPDGQDVVYSLQDREQTWLDLNLGNAATGATRTLFRETTKAWVDNQGDPTWLKDGSFLWTSERSGFKHIYHFKANGTLETAADERSVGSAHAVRRRRSERLGVFRGNRAEPDRIGRLPRQAGWHRAHASHAEARIELRELQPWHDRLDRHLE